MHLFRESLLSSGIFAFQPFISVLASRKLRFQAGVVQHNVHGGVAMIRTVKLCFACLTILLLIPAFFPLVTSAQQTLGAINGTVTDSTGAVVPNATVSLRSVSTNLTLGAQTKSDGSYSLFDLPIGTYEVTITQTGFQKVVYTTILIKGSQTTTVNAVLQPRAVTRASAIRR
jgi:hypothetical protein